MTPVVRACIFFAFANCRVLRFSANVLKGLCLVMFPATATLAEDAMPDGSQAATAAMAAFRLPDGFTAELFAADPMLTNPIAFCLDEHGRVFVAEDHRFLEGTPENRSHNFLLEDDLQVTTLADRLAMQTKWAHKFDKGSAWFTQTSDIVRQLIDSDGDGKADQSTVFAAGFDGPLDGLGSGVIARDGKVWYTCIPSLWLLTDTDNDGRADGKTSLLEGFGVNAGFYGHDLHGLVWGVDGKLYFSVGDRGGHVVTKEGATISNPRRGAVYRCNPDGTELERIHQGLRNPQELAMDQYGNLFADDNNCDKGDDSRLVYIVPGGDSGWNMAYQHIPEPYLTGPWHAEAIWHLQHDLQPAYVVPPVGKIGAGPSGFVFSSGTSLPPRYRNHFFYCNFTGNGGIESFAVEPQGAGFTIIDHHDFCKPVLASDVDFGYDGKMYLSDYPTNPFDRTTSGGRIYTVFDKTRIAQPIVVETRHLFQEGFEHRNAKDLITLLRHDDMRVRLRAQFVTLKVKTDDLVFASWVVDANRSPDVRIAALRLLNSRQFEELPGIIDTLLASDNAILRSEARDLLPNHDADRTTLLISQLLNDQQADMNETQRAFATLARMKSFAAGQTLDDWAVRLRERKVPASLQLDLIEALTAAPTESRQAAVNEFKARVDATDPLAAWLVALNGGNAERGRDLFVGHAVAQCIRCHTVDGRGGMAGPDLSAVAHPERNVDRRYLLESMMLPNAKIAKGFGTVTLVLDTGKLVAGTIKDEDADSVTLLTPSNETIRIARDAIDDQSATTSAMPAMTRTLTLRELRDLVEYLSTLTTKSEPR